MPVHTRERGSSPGIDGVKIKFYYLLFIKHDKADVGSPLLEAAPVQVFDHSGDTSRL